MENKIGLTIKKIFAKISFKTVLKSLVVVYALLMLFVLWGIKESLVSISYELSDVKDNIQYSATDELKDISDKLDSINITLEDSH